MIAINKRLDQWRRNLLMLWRNAEDEIPQEYKAEMLEFRSAAQKLLLRLGLIRSRKHKGMLMFDGDVVDSPDETIPELDK